MLGVHGSPYHSEKDLFWNSLADMDAKDDVPWVVMGDLNEVAWHFEKEGGAIWNPKRKRYLVDFMADNNLMDLGYKGHIFTWE